MYKPVNHAMFLKAKKCFKIDMKPIKENVNTPRNPYCFIVHFVQKTAILGETDIKFTSDGIICENFKLSDHYITETKLTDRKKEMLMELAIDKIFEFAIKYSRKLVYITTDSVKMVEVLHQKGFYLTSAMVSEKGTYKGVKNINGYC